jgi:hypothetical protein
MHYPQAEQAANPRQCLVSAFGENQANPFLIILNQRARKNGAPTEQSEAGI